MDLALTMPYNVNIIKNKLLLLEKQDWQTDNLFELGYIFAIFSYLPLIAIKVL